MGCPEHKCMRCPKHLSYIQYGGLGAGLLSKIMVLLIIMCFLQTPELFIQNIVFFIEALALFVRINSVAC